jgi:hypothetical protein
MRVRSVRHPSSAVLTPELVQMLITMLGTLPVGICTRRTDGGDTGNSVGVGLSFSGLLDGNGNGTLPGLHVFDAADMNFQAAAPTSTFAESNNLF